jgi:integrase/recombinase XerD
MGFFRLIWNWSATPRILAWVRRGAASLFRTSIAAPEPLVEVGLSGTDEFKVGVEVGTTVPKFLSDSELGEPASLEAFLSGKETLQVDHSAPWLKGEIIQEMQRFVQGQRSEHTKRAYEGDLKQFVSWLRAEKRSGENFDALLAFREWMIRPEEGGGAGLSRISANRKFAVVRAFLGWLQARGKARENPAMWIKNFRAKTESPTQAFSDAEVAHMLEMPNRGSASGLMHSVILHLLFYLGLRRGELVALRGLHVGFGRSGDTTIMTLRVPGKGDKERILPLPANTRSVLEKYMGKKGIKIGGEEYLFSPVRNNVTHTKSKPIATQAVYYIVKKYAALAGVERRVSPHSCRATAISNALDHSASHRSVQQMAGWSSPLMIERYDKRRTELQDSAVHVVEY